MNKRFKTDKLLLLYSVKGIVNYVNFDKIKMTSKLTRKQDKTDMSLFLNNINALYLNQHFVAFVLIECRYFDM